MKEIYTWMQQIHNQSAFNRVYEQYAYPLFQYAFSILRSRETAEEAVNDVFINCWSNRERLPEVKNLPVYLYVSVKNQCLNRLSQAKREQSIDWDQVAACRVNIVPNPEQLLMSTELKSRIEEAVSALPPKCQLIFMMVKEDGLRHKEVAEILGISVSTVETQINIAIKRIARTLQLMRGIPETTPSGLP